MLGAMSHSDPVHTLADLENWPKHGTWLAVLGHPIKHSISPVMHNAALAELAKTKRDFSDWRYVKFDVEPEQLGTALELLRSKGFVGLNLTVPHKVVAFGLLSDIAPAARAIGAVNTLRAVAAGWTGDNTDAFGLSEGVRTELGLDLHGLDVILLGAGGAARGAAVECLRKGVSSLWIANRTAANRESLIASVRSEVRGETKLEGFDPGNPPRALPEKALVINATSLGLKPEDPAPADLARLHSPRAVFDMVYNPPKTALLGQAESLGLPRTNGLAMLVNQGAKALSLWTGVPSEQLAPVMAAAARKALYGK